MGFTEKISSMTELEATARLREVEALLAKHNQHYHGEDAPEITDGEFDALKAEFRALSLLFPYLVKPQSAGLAIGAKPRTGFAKIQHDVPMTSLDNLFTPEDWQDYLSRLRNFLGPSAPPQLQFLCEPKIDGLSLSLSYVQGKLQRAATRGDGLEGEDVTENVKSIADIPQSLQGDGWPPKLEIRGEVYMERQDFLALNQRQAEQGDKLFANPRNAAAGSLRQLDAKITKSRPLRFLAFGLLLDGESTEAGGGSGKITNHLTRYPSQSALMDLAVKWGFRRAKPHLLALHETEVMDYFAQLGRQRPDLPFEIDGAVYKLDDRGLQARLGFVGRVPRFAIAHKFPAETAITRLEAITIQVGRTGVLTPVAQLQPIGVGGVMVGRATLHNQDEIERRDVRPGDLVEIRRAGDVIPQIIAAIIEPGRTRAPKWQMPSHCPCPLQTPVTRKEREKDREAASRCGGGFACPTRQLEQLKHFVSRSAFDIEGLGGKTLEEFWQEGLVTSPPQIFTLAKREKAGAFQPLAERRGWGNLSSANLYQAIEARRTIELRRLIYGLGIAQVGEITARQLAKRYESAEGFFSVMYELGCALESFGYQESVGNSEDDWHEAWQGRLELLTSWQSLKEIDGIGLSMARDMVSYFANPSLRQMVNELRQELIEIIPEPIASASSLNGLSGKTVVFTGSLTNLTRAEAKARAEASGAKVGSDISSRTDYLVMGEDAGSKRKKALDLGINIISEAQFIALMEMGPQS